MIARSLKRLLSKKEYIRSNTFIINPEFYLFNMKFSNFKYSFIFLVYLCLGCSPDAIMEDIPDPNNPSTPITPSGNENYLNKGSEYIFDQNKLLKFELNLPQSNLSKIDANPTLEEYVEGSLSFEGETIRPVGIRYKGSIGAFVGCVSGSDWTNPSGRKTCTKLSMKIKINWSDPDASFYGIRKLQFHSQNLDASQMRDRLGYWLFSQMGVPSPRCVHALLYINGQFIGVFALVEQVDGRFARENFSNGKGNVYKEVWPLDMNGKAQSEKALLESLETNEDENPSTEIIRSFGRELESAETKDVPAVITKWMDIDEIISYAVVDRVIRVDDGPFHWYCNGSSCFNHNYYWYGEPTKRSVHLIPWDLDNAFENISSNRNPVTPIKDKWGEITNNCQPFGFGFLNIKQRSAACDKLTAGWVSFSDKFNEKKLQFISGPFAESKVNAQLNSWSAQIREATTLASQTHTDALTVQRWESAMSELKASLNFARVN